MNIIALIPARCGSKRVKDKNIRPVGDWPLMRWSVESAKQAELFSKVIVSTDSEVYAEMARGWGAEVVMRFCANDSQTDRYVIEDAIVSLPEATQEEIDLIAYLRPTTPFRTATMLRKAVKTMVEAGDNATGLRSVEEMGESAFKCFTLTPGPILREIQAGKSDMPNQNVIPTYRGNGYIDIAKASEIRAGRLWGDRVIGFITPRVMEIDTEDDLQYADWYAKTRNVREEVVFR